MRGIRDFEKRKQLYYFIKNQEIDIMFLQETHCTDRVQNLWSKQWGSNIYCSNGTSNSCGVMVLFKRDLPIQVIKTVKDGAGRLIVLECKFEAETFLLSNLYAPNQDSPGFFLQAFSLIEEFGTVNKILGGDFNLVLNAIKDRNSASNYHPHALSVVETYLEQAEMCDVWRLRNPDKRVFTWHRSKPSWQASRIDFFLVSNSMLNMVHKVNILAGFRSDHSSITLELRIANEVKRGKGVWKFNNSLLRHKAFVERINNCINLTIVENRDVDPITVWESVKNAIINESVQYAIGNARAKNEIIGGLEGKLSFLKEQLDANFDPFLNQELIDTQIQLENYVQTKVQSVIFRSKAKWLVEGERSSKYYFALEKANYDKKLMRAIKLQDGTIIDDQAGILKEQVHFYRRLYRSNPDVQFDLKNMTDTMLNEEQKKVLDNEITLPELTRALNSMKLNKTPGLDGLTVELYQTFWDKLGPIYLHLIQYCLRQGQLNATARQGLIQQIPKKDRDPLMIANWRPLTLLNVDYKILSKCLALRMKLVLPDIIDDHQTGFMAGRDISTNIRKVIEVIEYCKEADIPGVIMSVDFEKCFDKIEKTAIFGALEYFNFGPRFIAYSKLLFEDFVSRVQCNGFLSDTISVSRSTHQGCPAAPFFYLLCGQIFSHLITNNPNIRGIRINDVEELLSQFADDTDLFLSYEPVTFREIDSVFQIIHDHMGFTVNYDKTTVYRIGSLRNTNAIMYTKRPLAWTNDPINVLGVTVSDREAESMQCNFQDIINKVKVITNLWVSRSATLSGKILIVNTLIASLYIYKMKVFSLLPKDIIDQFEAAVCHFLWNNRRAKISKEILKLPRKYGGLKLVDLRTRHMALQVQWINLAQDNQFFARILRNKLNTPIHDDVWCCNFKPRHVKEIFPQLEGFWYHVVVAWAHYNFAMPEDLDDILNQFLWYNSLIRRENVPFVLPRAYRAGILRVGHIVNCRGEFMSYDELINQFGGCITWLEYLQIQSAFHPEWLRLIRLGPINFQATLTKFQRLTQNNKWSGLVYDQLIEVDGDMKVLSKCERWSRYLEVDITYAHFRKSFENVLRTTLSTKLRDFQFRLLHCIIFLNDKLFQWKKVDSPLCTFCNKHKENYMHLFINCEKVKPIWQQLKTYIMDNDQAGVQHELTFQPCNIILNSVHARPGHVCNLLVLIVKQYLFRCKCLKNVPNSIVMINEVESMYQLEEYIAGQTNSLAKHYEKWSCLKDLSEDILSYTSLSPHINTNE